MFSSVLGEHSESNLGQQGPDASLLTFVLWIPNSSYVSGSNSTSAPSSYVGLGAPARVETSVSVTTLAAIDGGHSTNTSSNTSYQATSDAKKPSSTTSTSDSSTM